MTGFRVVVMNDDGRSLGGVWNNRVTFRSVPALAFADKTGVKT